METDYAEERDYAIVMIDCPNKSPTKAGDLVTVYPNQEASPTSYLVKKEATPTSYIWAVKAHQMLFIGNREQNVNLFTLQTLIKLRNHVKSRSNKGHGQPL